MVSGVMLIFFVFFCSLSTNTNLIVISLFHGQMNITLKDAKKQKVTKHSACNHINVIHQQYPGLLKSL